MKTAIACPTHQQLMALSLGRLTNEESDSLFQHISECDRCRSELETVEDAGDSLIVSLRDPVDGVDYRAEPDCHVAVIKALGALANSDRDSAENDFDQIPKTIGEYQILKPLGSGGMGNVFLARHTKLGREVALKVLASHRLGEARTAERFEAEMRAIGRLSHPNIVTAHDAREVDGTAVLVTEFVSGLDLGQLLQRTGALKMADACEIARRVAVALSYTNSQGFVHRDIKPSNVMLSDQGEIKLLDLGLARLQFGETEQTEFTATGQAMGTADYVAPEQVTDSKTVDIRADIYALGCTLFKLLTGRAPFADDRHATTFAKMTAHVSEPPPSLGDLLPSTPRSLVQLVDSMLAKNPADRPAAPQEIVVALAPHSRNYDLRKLIHEAQLLEPRKNSGAPSSAIAKPATQPWMKRTIPSFVAIATGFFGFMLGVCLSIIIVITNPDGTKTFLRLAEGSKVEVQEGNSRGQPDLSEKGLPVVDPNSRTPKVMDQESDVTPLSFGILVNRESTGHSPSVSESQILEATRLLRAADGSQPIRTPFGTWYALADNALGAPIKEMNAGKSFVLVSNQYSIPWQSIQGHILYVEPGRETGVGNGQSERSIDLKIDQELGRTFAILSKQNLGNQFAIIVQGQVRSAPRLASEVRQQLTITGIFSLEETQQLLDHLRMADLHRALSNSARTNSSGIGYLGVQMDNTRDENAAGSLVVQRVGALISSVQPASPAEKAGLQKGDIVLEFDGVPIESDGHLVKVVASTPIGRAVTTRILRDYEKIEKQVVLIALPDTRLLELQRNMKLLGLGFYNFESAFGKFPGSANTVEGGNAPEGKKIYPFSWRVAILPYIDQVELYKEYHFDEPWNSQHNLTLLAKMPAVYRSPFVNAETQPRGQANILGYATNDSAIGNGGGEKINSFTDGTANTLLLVETNDTVPWTKPEDLALDGSVNPFFLDHPLTYLMADCSVRSENHLSRETLQKMISRNGGDIAQPQEGAAGFGDGGGAGLPPGDPK